MIVFYDDAEARRFEPFATTRPLCEMRAGAVLVRERWQYVLSAPSSGFVSTWHLDGFAEFDAPPFTRDDVPASRWLVNTRALPMLDARTASASAVLVNGRVAAVRVAGTTPALSLRDGSLSLEELVPASGTLVNVDGMWLDSVWDLVAHLPELLTRDIPLLAQRVEARSLDVSASGCHQTGAHPVWVEAGAVVEPFVVFDTTAGPILLRRGAQVQAFTRMIGPCYVGQDSVVSTDRIAASAIGEQCKVHGELSTSILIGYANKGHDGFVGHSVLGRWVNLGAGTITSNLKNTYGTVSLWTPDGVRDSGMQFLGTLFGDHVKTGIGLRLNTGSVVGPGANLFGDMPAKMVRPFAWGGGSANRYSADKFITAARRAMARRQVSLDDAAEAWWLTVHATSISSDRWGRAI